uniref:Uncharacterized protein n=1 Tax=Rhizophora mucronata TaxID=61149 RepID=A0A2P2ITE4_RHIMU
MSCILNSFSQIIREMSIVKVGMPRCMRLNTTRVQKNNYCILQNMDVVSIGDNLRPFCDYLSMSQVH